MDKTAIEAIAKLAIEASASNRVQMHTPAFIADGGKVVSLEHLLSGRSRYRGLFSTSFLQSFGAYVKENAVVSPAQCFVDAAEFSALAYFNLGDENNPGHADWRATLVLQRTAAYSALLGINGKQQSQRAAVEWLEDWADHLECENGVPAAITALRSITVNVKNDAGSTVKDFGAARTALEQIEANADGKIPAFLTFTTQPFQGFKQRDYRLRVGIITGEKPSIVLRIVGFEQIVEETALEFRDLLTGAVGDSATVAVGTFQP